MKKLVNLSYEIWKKWTIFFYGKKEGNRRIVARIDKEINRRKRLGIWSRD